MNQSHSQARVRLQVELHTVDSDPVWDIRVLGFSIV
ncbi:MAG: hypothetical protein ACI93R_004257 [Flavobacteriales bacterium]|jgi:hypothetical protein